MIEVKCLKCGETFVIADDDNLIHWNRDEGEECGGRGEIVIWSPERGWHE
jgi:hypothetical protein